MKAAITIQARPRGQKMRKGMPLPKQLREKAVLTIQAAQRSHAKNKDSVIEEAGGSGHPGFPAWPGDEKQGSSGGSSGRGRRLRLPSRPSNHAKF